MTGPGETRFGWALLSALAIEVLAIIALVWVPPLPKPHEIRPATMAIHLVQPAKPPKSPPLRPQPVQAPQPKPPPPLPVLPKPPPPVPDHPHIQVPRHPPPRPARHVAMRPAVHPAPPQPTAPPVAAPPSSQIALPSPSPAQIQSAEARYVGIIRGVILGNLVVPDALRNLAASGRATVAFKVMPDGQIVWARVIAASDYRAANRAALAAVRDSHFPAFLARMPGHPIVFEIPINVSGAN